MVGFERAMRNPTLSRASSNVKLQPDGAQFRERHIKFHLGKGPAEQGPRLRRVGNILCRGAVGRRPARKGLAFLNRSSIS